MFDWLENFGKMHGGKITIIALMLAVATLFPAVIAVAQNTLVSSVSFYGNKTTVLAIKYLYTDAVLIDFLAISFLIAVGFVLTLGKLKASRYIIAVWSIIVVALICNYASHLSAIGVATAFQKSLTIIESSSPPPQQNLRLILFKQKHIPN